MKGAKGAGKKGLKKCEKSDRSKGKGVWTAAGDHGGAWVPTRAQPKGAYSWLPYPTEYQYAHPWHPEEKGMHWIQFQNGPS